jgi:DNA replication factor GINS
MELEEIQSARSRERRTDSLQPLADSFYTEAGEFITELRAKRTEIAAEADDPFDSSEVRRLTNSIETAENTVEAIYERRVGKVLKLASLDAAGMSTDDDGLTPEERDLFGTLTDAIERNRRQVIEGIATSEADTGTSATAEAIEGEPTAASDQAPDTDTGADADDAREAEAPRADPDRAPEAPEPPTEEPADDRVRNAIADDVRTEETRDRNGNGHGDGGGKAEPMGAADAMGAPAGTASEPSADPDRETAGGTSTADSRPEEARGTRDGSPDPAGASEPPAGAKAKGNGDSPPENGDRTGDAGGENRTPPRDGPSEGTETTDRQTVRITRDIGEIVGIDERVYELASEDVVQLPAANAKPLVDRDAAERLE